MPTRSSCSTADRSSSGVATRSCARPGAATRCSSAATRSLSLPPSSKRLVRRDCYLGCRDATRQSREIQLLVPSFDGFGSASRIPNRRSRTRMSHSFGALGVSAEVEQALDARGIVEPFRIQSLVVPDALEGRDILGKAPTGSGKTLAFALPIVELVSAGEPAPAALVLAPTRELALQVTDELVLLGKPKGIRAAAAYGGAPVGAQANGLRGAHVVGAHPRRLTDLGP